MPSYGQAAGRTLPPTPSLSASHSIPLRVKNACSTILKPAGTNFRAGCGCGPFPHSTHWPGPRRGGDADYSVTGTLLLGEMGCGTFSRLVISGSNAGQVWLDDRSWGGLTQGPDFGTWYTAWLASQ